MISRLARSVIARFAFGALVCLALAAGRAAAEPHALADSTWVDRWRLKNGMEVTARNVPECDAVAVIVAYHVGVNQDPPDRAGMADLLCEVMYTAAAGDVPERTREEIAELRPLGWNTQVAPRFTLVSEVATVRQFPGVLRQVASRVAGVTVTDSLLARARQTTLRERGRVYAESPELTLLSQLRELAVGASDQELLSRLTGGTIRDVTAGEAEGRLRRLYVPANAVLALAGNLGGLDLHALVSNLFEAIPGGTPSPEPPEPTLRAVGRAFRRPTLAHPMGGVGIIAPALSDSLHPDFYLNSLVIGRFCNQVWGPIGPPLNARFRYPVLADPQIARFFPPVEPDETDPDRLGVAMQGMMEQMAVAVFGEEDFDRQRLDNQWIFGGPFTPSFKRRVRTHPGTLHTLASTLAVRALWGSDEFWARYLARFMNPRATRGERWTDYFQAPDHIVRLLFTPARP